MNADRPVLVGPASVDRFVDEGVDVPGGGALNMAYHWARRGLPFELVTRVSSSDRALFEPFFRRHRIEVSPSAYADGPSCAVDVRIGADRQPRMDRFVEGVWADTVLTDDEIDRIAGSTGTHLVLVDVVDRALHDLVGRRRVSGVEVTGDFLGFGHFDLARFDATFPHLGVGFVGWPGSPDDPVVAALCQRPGQLGNVLVVTFGAAGVRVVDGRGAQVDDRWFEVDAVEVAGTTIGCGDAFIAAFLASWWSDRDVSAAVDAGRELGAAATGWWRALPEVAYS